MHLGGAPSSDWQLFSDGQCALHQVSSVLLLPLCRPVPPPCLLHNKLDGSFVLVQVPFFATHEAKRKRGYGRALVEAIEEVRRLQPELHYQ